MAIGAPNNHHTNISDLHQPTPPQNSIPHPQI